MISAGRGLLPYLIAFLFVLNAIAPIIQFHGLLRIGMMRAGASTNSMCARCAAPRRTIRTLACSSSPRARGMIRCASSARDNLIAIAASLLEASYFLPIRRRVPRPTSIMRLCPGACSVG